MGRRRASKRHVRQAWAAANKLRPPDTSAFAAFLHAFACSPNAIQYVVRRVEIARAEGVQEAGACWRRVRMGAHVRRATRGVRSCSVRPNLARASAAQVRAPLTVCGSHTHCTVHSAQRTASEQPQTLNKASSRRAEHWTLTCARLAVWRFRPAAGPRAAQLVQLAAEVDGLATGRQRWASGGRAAMIAAPRLQSGLVGQIGGRVGASWVPPRAH